jgi:hypothetical protein
MRVRVTRRESNRAWPDVATRLTIRIMNEPPDPHRRGRAFADALATVSVESAARSGFVLTLTPETPVVPDEDHPWLTKRGTWGDLGILIRHWTEIGCDWVNLEFGLDEQGAAVVRYEAKPEGEPLPDGRLPAFNGGFNHVRRRVPRDG